MNINRKNHHANQLFPVGDRHVDLLDLIFQTNETDGDVKISYVNILNYSKYQHFKKLLLLGLLASY